jgi:hypothetical protein
MKQHSQPQSSTQIDADFSGEASIAAVATVATSTTPEKKERSFPTLECVAQKASPHRALVWMILIGFAIRLFATLLLYGEQLSLKRDRFEFGWEVGRVAQSVALGHGFASPLFGDTGPTAWLPPAYVYLLAGVFRLFGPYTAAAAIAILVLNNLCSALTAWPLVAISGRLLGHFIAIRTGWVWTFFPFAIFIAATRVWGECLDALLVTLVVLMAFRMAETDRPAIWLTAGIVAGTATLTNPNTLSIVPALWYWACCRLKRNGCRVQRPVVFAVLTLTFIVGTWMVRNSIVLQELLPIRSNFWLELYVGNNPEASVMLVDWNRHPASNEFELAEYKELGELGYMQRKRKEVLSFIEGHPATFVISTLRRFVFVWTGFWSWDRRYLASEPFRLPFVLFTTALSTFTVMGLLFAWKQEMSTSVPLAAVLLFQPLVYYITHPALEYRHAIDPMIVTFAAYGAYRLRRTGQTGYGSGHNCRGQHYKTNTLHANSHGVSKFYLRTLQRTIQKSGSSIAISSYGLERPACSSKSKITTGPYDDGKH